LFAWVFDVGISGAVDLVTNASADGTELGPRFRADDHYVVWGEDGVALRWPPGVPTESGGDGIERARLETLLVILADRRQDLRQLETRDSGIAGDARSPLASVLAAAARGIRGEGIAPRTIRYRVEHLDFYLEPPS
jgi:hypothetical protein